MMSDDEAIREQVRERYAEAALAVRAGGSGCCGSGAEAGGAEATGRGATGAGATGARVSDVRVSGATALEVETSCGAAYDADQRASLPAAALQASLGCGNPHAVADLRSGEVVLDLGSGGGIDVLLSARRVGPTDRAYGVDMTPEMLELARANAVEAGASNVEFLEGDLTGVPLPDSSVDVVISNCVINLAADKAPVFAEMFRLLRPGGRVGVSDVVADAQLSPAERAERGDWVGCIAGALTVEEYTAGLAAAGFVDIEITPSYEVADGMHSAIVRAGVPVD